MQEQTELLKHLSLVPAPLVDMGTEAGEAVVLFFTEQIKQL
jgi:hypothetical protein